MDSASFQLIGAKAAERNYLFRPEGRSGLGLRSGNLTVDGSTTAMEVKQVADGCTYEIALPLGEIKPMSLGVGKSFGFSVSLVDNDGSGNAATITWGHGIDNNDPSLFGSIIMLDAPQGQGDRP